MQSPPDCSMIQCIQSSFVHWFPGHLNLINSVLYPETEVLYSVLPHFSYKSKKQLSSKPSAADTVHFKTFYFFQVMASQMGGQQTFLYFVSVFLTTSVFSFKCLESLLIFAQFWHLYQRFTNKELAPGLSKKKILQFSFTKVRSYSLGLQYTAFPILPPYMQNISLLTKTGT